ncbi:hypothetical protein [uncultured Brachyspira sp.]|uniref:hypothetical protein n=1 Tax=uncultured Brachyspira sp. TaxID=221953 RepID=UPI0026238609|nr:hypothetical protein [uncultured Brachyspira sp.]
MLKYFIIFIALLNVIYAQESTNQTKTSEYTFTYEKENNFNISDTNALNEVSIMIERRGLPLVNRLVRFTSLKPDVFTFENAVENEISLKEMDEEEENTNEVNMYTNVYIVPTDENGVAKAKLHLNGTGEGVVLMHILYVGSTGNTNISYEEFAHVNIYDDNDSFSYKILNGDGKSINVKGSMIMTLTLFPALFLVAIALILISYFKHIYDEYRTAKSKIIMYTFFGFSAIKKNFKLMMIIILIELIIVASFMFLDSYIFSVLLIAFFISGFIVKREKIYSIAFFILSCISMIYLYLQTFMNYLGLECLFNSSIMGNPVFIFLLFIILTALAGGIYIPLSILVLYKTIFNISDLSLIMALIGIFIASVLYIVKVKKDIPFLYSLNLLKIKD